MKSETKTGIIGGMKPITVSAEINADREKTWSLWTEPHHITKWNFATEDWECPSAENDLRENGRFTARMSAKDGSEGFDFGGTYTEVVPQTLIAYVMDDGRTVRVVFSENDEKTIITETFDPETENIEELQRSGWQSILDNFKRYAESV